MNNVKWSSDKARKKMSCLSSKPASNFRVKTKQKSKRDHFLTWPFLFKKDKLCNEFLINKYYVSLFFHIRINYFLLWKGSLDTKHCPCFSFPRSIKKNNNKDRKIERISLKITNKNAASPHGFKNFKWWETRIFFLALTRQESESFRRWGPIPNKLTWR